MKRNYSLQFTMVLFFIACSFSAAAQNKLSKKSQAAIAGYEKYFEENKDAHLKEFLELVSMPGISSIPSHKTDIENTAAWIVKKLQSIGMTTARVIPTSGNPVVYGSWEGAKGKPTVLIYAHYDVQPVKESEWKYPPFAGAIENGRIYGRGTSDDKSGVMVPVWAAEAMLKKDKALPVNVKFIFDGEEEIGSPDFHKFLADNKEMLKADFALNADGGQFNDSIPSVWMAFRGGVQLEFNVKTANFDAHSGAYGGKTPNAVKAISEIIASLYNNDGSVAVAGFYDNVIPVTAAEKEMIKKIPYNPADDMKELGATAEVGDTNYSSLERLWYRPTLEIIGMWGGYTAAEGYSNIIPGTATARITCRLVSNQSGEGIIQSIVKHINGHCPAGATVTYKFRPLNVKAMKFPNDTKAFQYVSDALTNVYGRAPLQTAVGGSVGPLIDMKELLGLYAYSFGVQQLDEKPHGANEFLRVTSIKKGQMLFCNYFLNLAEAEGKLKK